LRFFDGSGGSAQGRRAGEGWFGDVFSGFEEMRRQMERQLQEQVRDIQTKAPKELVREYETSEGAKVRDRAYCVWLFCYHWARRKTNNKGIWKH